MFRHSHGGTGCGSAHSPRLPARASDSNCSNVVFPGAYFRYHQHQPSLTNHHSAAVYQYLTGQSRLFFKLSNCVQLAICPLGILPFTFAVYIRLEGDDIVICRMARFCPRTSPSLISSSPVNVAQWR